MAEAHGECTPESVLTRALAGLPFYGTETARAVAFKLLRVLANAGYAITDASADGPGHYTREEVSAAVNGAADMLPEHEYETEETIAQDDTANFVVSAAMYLLDHPNADVNEVIAAEYTDVVIDEDDVDEGEEVPEQGSPRWNELVVARVLGWVET